MGLATALGFQGTATCRSCLRIALDGAFYGAIQRLGPIGRIGVIVPGLGRDLDDPILRQSEVIDPSPYMGPCWPTLPPDREGRIYGKAQCAEQFCEEPIKIRISRLRVLLLLYRFT